MQTTDLWHSPILCGCVLERTRRWQISQPVKSKSSALMLRHLEETHQFDEVIETYKIMEQCGQHRHLTADGLAKELLNYGQNCHSPDTCECKIVYWFDKRQSSEQRQHIPLEHPVHTKRCQHHAHLLAARDHHAAVIAENQHKNISLNAKAVELGVEPESLRWEHDTNRNLIIHT